MAKQKNKNKPQDINKNIAVWKEKLSIAEVKGSGNGPEIEACKRMIAYYESLKKGN